MRKKRLFVVRSTFGDIYWVWFENRMSVGSSDHQQTNLFHQIGHPRNGIPINAKRGDPEDGFFLKDRREYETLLSRSESEPAWRMRAPRYLRVLNPHQTAGPRSNEIAQHRSAAKSMIQANFSNDTNPIHIGRTNTATPAALGRKPARSRDPELGTSL